MKLPATRKDRILMFAGIGVGVVSVLVAGVVFGIVPLLDARRAMETSIVDIGEKVKKAERVLDYAPAIQQEYDDAVGQMVKIRAENILRPILGSYLVGVAEQIESVARATRMRVEDVREVGVVNIPGKGKNASLQTFKSFVVHVNAEGGYESIVQFLKQMEDRNPFFSISEITITSQQDNPELHRLATRMEWPIEPSTENGKGAGL